MRWVSERDAMALPNLGTLSLRSASAPPTGEFWTLSREEADERNADGGDVEPLTHQEYAPSRERTDGGEYFRVRYMYRNTPSFENPDAPMYLYYMFEAEPLWRYAREHGRNPSNREDLWREDWRQLHDRYDPGTPEPWFVATLPSLNEPVEVHAGGGQEGRLVRIEFPDYGLAHYEGDEGEERLVRTALPDGEVQHYEGDKGEEHRVRSEWPNGEVTHYEGDKGEERLVRLEFPNGEGQHYEGDAGEEHRVRAEWINGQVLHYEGDAGEEHRVRSEWPNGQVQHYEGDKGKEHKVHSEWPNGQVFHYEGDEGEERLVRAVLPDGEVQYYEGDKGGERLVRTALPDREVQ